jgi:hypothetical protein
MNRIERPIIRKWGICFRSTQSYTVCGLTPRNAAASGTRTGSSPAVAEALETVSVGMETS